jgi:hypothetical protein
VTNLADELTAPPVLFSLALGLFLLMVRSPWPWTRVGGGFAVVAALALLAAAVADPGARALLLDSERLPILVLVAASGAALWTGFHRALHGPRGRHERPPWRGPSPAEKLAGGVVVALAALAAFALGAPPAPMADPAAGGGTAPWFLAGLRAMSWHFDPWVPAVLVPLLAVAGLVALPYLDVPAQPPPASAFDERRDVVCFFVFVWFLLALLPMAAAAFLRPEAAAMPPELAPSFSELAWSRVVEPPPRAPWVRELPAFAVLALYFVVLPRQLPRWKPTRALFGRYLKRLGPRRFYAAMALMGLWILIPLKMVGRWLLGIGYFLDLPELSLRF